MNKKYITTIASLVVLLTSSCGTSTSYNEDNFLPTGDKIVKEKINLTFFAPLHPLHHKDGFNSMKLFQKMEEITNIHINWTYGATSNYDSLRAAQWQSNTRPDAFFLWNPADEVMEYGEQGVIYPLDTYINDYAPYYKEILGRDEKYVKTATMNDGNMYSFLSINNVPRDQTFKQYINKKWLENLNLSMPTTVEEYYNVLSKFKTDDPNGNGIPDEIPLSSASLFQSRNFLMSAFGYVSTGMELDNEGELVYVPSTDAYRAYLTYANSLYKNGLLDNNTFIMQERDLAAKGNIVGSFDAAAAYLVAGMENNDDYAAIPPLTSSLNSQKMWLGFHTTTPEALIIPKSSPYVKEIVRWMDFLYSPLGIQLQAFGEEGVDFIWKDEQKTSFTFPVPSNKSIEEYRGTITPGVGLGQVAFWDQDFVLKEDNEFTRSINEAVEEAGYMDYIKTPIPQLIFTKAEKNEIAIIQTDLDIYIETFEQRIISGKLALNDNTWANHLSTLNQIRLTKLLEVYQSAYNRYLEEV